MPTVWKHPKSPYWMAVFRDENNVWRKKTTKKKSRAKALALALEFERAADLARDRQLTESTCREIIGSILERATGQALRFDSVREFCRRWLDSKIAAKSDRTCAKYEATVDRFLAFLKLGADRPINAIEPRQCQAFYDELVGRRLAPATLKVEMTILRGLFNRARRLGIISTNPAEAVDLPEQLGSAERKVFTPTQVELLLKQTTMEPEWKTAILFGYYGGLRIGDAAARDWQEVDFAAHSLVFRMEKTGRRLELPLHPVLENHLQAIAGDQGGLISPHLAARTVGGNSGLSRQFLTMMRHAGISQESTRTAGKRQLSTLSFHSLRKTFNSALHNMGVSQEVRKKLTGHKSDAVNDLYTQSELHTLSDAVTRLPRLAI